MEKQRTEAKTNDYGGNYSAVHEVTAMFSENEWRRKANTEMAKLIIAEEVAATQREKDIIHLKELILNITPYSRWWRWGYVGSLKRAIKALERVNGNADGD